ncbi:rlmE [Acanthosepion pharaonis]|uniref:rRNA methyltransferase 2, mitochondrial n=1 Tax=Acanthosepion pharaonis TaxID=158019 RepID=A0A812C0R6_ACAPH|nr:rlmE [Sepia pharaonis]
MLKLLRQIIPFLAIVRPVFWISDSTNIELSFFLSLSLALWIIPDDCASVMSLKFWKCLKRYFSSSSKLRKHSSKPHNLKGKSTSSQKWITRQLKDPYVKRAREESYRCRSAFKLVEIDDRFDLLRPGSVVIDCGAAPGSWTQVAVERVNAAGTAKSQKEGCVISIDKQFMVPVKGAITLATMDFTKGQTQNKVLEVLSGRKADIILSDMAPNTTGIRSMDHDLIIELCFSVLEFSRTVLRPDGALLCKLWQGHEQKELEQRLGDVFQTVKIIKPQASRGDSAEIFLLGKGYTPNKSHIQ